jgi:hypothetical protein
VDLLPRRDVVLVATEQEHRAGNAAQAHGLARDLQLALEHLVLDEQVLHGPQRAAGAAERVLRLAADGGGEGLGDADICLVLGSSLARMSPSAASMAWAVAASPRSAASSAR